MSREGSIINCTSVAAYTGRPDMLDYAASKGALTAFTYSLAQSNDVLEKRIRVNAVAAGHTWTPMVEASYSGTTSQRQRQLSARDVRAYGCRAHASCTDAPPAPVQARSSAASARTRS